MRQIQNNSRQGWNCQIDAAYALYQAILQDSDYVSHRRWSGFGQTYSVKGKRRCVFL